jgi:hypothetical protein
MDDTSARVSRSGSGALAPELPFDLHVQTLAGYERGAIQLAASKYIVLCRAMGMSAPDLLAWAMQRAGVDLPTRVFRSTPARAQPPQPGVSVD